MLESIGFVFAGLLLAAALASMLLRLMYGNAKVDGALRHGAKKAAVYGVRKYFGS